MFQGALRQVLPSGNGLGLQVSLNQYAAHAALPQFDGQAQTNRPAPNDQNLGFQGYAVGVG
jgi:hypothetical protein